MAVKPVFFLFLYILADYSLLFFLEGNPILLSTVSNILLTITSLITVTVLLKTYTNQNNQIKKFTLLLLLGCLSYSIGSIYWTYYEYMHMSPPTLGLYDFFMLLVYIFFIWALIYYFKTHKVVLAATYLFDILIFTVITATLSWVFIVRPFLMPTFDAHSLLMSITSLGYPIADLTILFACLIIFLYTSLSKSILLIILGFLINIMANSINFYQSAHTTYLFDHLLDPLWVLSNLLIGFSGLDNFKVNQRTYPKKYFRLFIPYSIMIIFLFVLYIHFYDIKNPLFIGVFISIVLLMIRLFTTIYSNESLNQEINRKNLQLKDANEKLKFLAYHDELTKLPNRHFLFEKIQNEMKATINQNQCHFYLLFIDLDGFKSVNDTFGHYVGDKLLRQVSCRLKEQLPEGDFLCRFAGDEFIMLLSDSDQIGVKKMAAAIVESLAKQYLIDSHKISISASIGISAYKETDSLLSVMNRADKAMYDIKKNGKNSFGIM
ncbi:GGDEF domain-containing protein [Neobacillus muris]|uniref:GGDEF domain-containing protein n=1 Tax=Neobacillus muris TaxID=2941334 RepID=UPI00203E13BA|nr:GGDEF domain-containing protein [Neobacillus muris]